MQTQVLLDNMSGKTDFIGKPIKAVAYNSHKTNKRSNTIAVSKVSLSTPDFLAIAVNVLVYSINPLTTVFKLKLFKRVVIS